MSVTWAETATDIKMSGNKAVLVISCIILPILPVNMIALSILQKNVNKLLEA